MGKSDIIDLGITLITVIVAAIISATVVHFLINYI